MEDPSYFDAQMHEHGAEPAHLFTGPNESPVMVIVRAFADDEAIRLTIEDRSGEINQQLLINRNALRHLADDPEETSQQQ
ncbi:MAG TPA: hypothetical protein VI168_04415 [Croceibacterium sp.]|jgi:hypothetical protein